MTRAPRRPFLGLAAVLGVVALTAGPVPAYAGTTPFTDPSAVARLTLCDRSGQAVTSGDIHAQPFIWRAVSSDAAPQRYSAPGRTAALLGYQPRQGVDPGSWSGQLLTASARYADAAHPTAAATGADPALADFLSDFPARWDGLVQVRLYLGAPDTPPSTTRYAAVTIKVDGDRWTAIDAGSTPCSVAKATSVESILLPASTTAGTQRPGPRASSSSVASPSSAASASSPSTATTAAGASPTADASTADSVARAGEQQDSTTRTSLITAGAVLLGLALALLVVRAVARRRRTTS